MKPFAKTSLVVLSSAMIGGALTAGTLKHLDSQNTKPNVTQNEVASPDDLFNNFFKEHRKNFSNLLSDDFFSKDPFKEMQLFHERFEKQMNNIQGTSSYDISEREDSQNVYYDIKVPDINSTSIKTNVENGQLTITGTIEKKNENESASAQSFFKSSFQRSFPLPDNVDQHKMEMTNENDKIVLKFPKLTV